MLAIFRLMNVTKDVNEGGQKMAKQDAWWWRRRACRIEKTLLAEEEGPKKNADR